MLSYGQSFEARYIYFNPSCSVSPSRHISFPNIVDSRPEEDLDKDNQTESRKKEEDAQILKASAPDNFTFCPLFYTVYKYIHKPPNQTSFCFGGKIIILHVKQYVNSIQIENDYFISGTKIQITIYMFQLKKMVT